MGGKRKTKPVSYRCSIEKYLVSDATSSKRLKAENIDERESKASHLPSQEVPAATYSTKNSHQPSQSVRFEHRSTTSSRLSFQSVIPAQATNENEPTRSQSIVEVPQYSKRKSLHTQAVRAVVCVSRKSNRISGTEEQRTRSINELHRRNTQLYDTFQSHLHPELHDVCPEPCPAEQFSIVADNLSSNENISTFQHPQLRRLRDLLAQLASDDGLIFIVYSGKDGLTTNTKGLCELFSGMMNVNNIHFAIYMGMNSFPTFPLTQILQAIDYYKTINTTEKPVSAVHALVLDWYTVMYNKEQQARASRDLKSTMPMQRNKTEIIMNRPVLPEVKAIMEKPTNPEERFKVWSQRSREGFALHDKLIERHELTFNNETQNWKYPLDTCSDSVAEFETLLKHIYAHCRKAGKCVLCPTDKPHNSGRNVVFKNFEATKHTRAHLERHLPPQASYPYCPATFSSEYNLQVHLPYHDLQSSTVDRLKCEHCEESFFDKKDLVAHRAEKHGWVPENRIYMCRHLCGATFDQVPNRIKHEDTLCEMREFNTIRVWCCSDCEMEFTSASELNTHRHAEHERGAEVREILSEIGINSMPVVGSTAIRAKIEGASEGREDERRNGGGIYGWYDRNHE